MDDNSEQLTALRELLAAAIEKTGDMDANSRSAFAEAAQVLEGSSTGYGAILKKQANRVNQEVGEAIDLLTQAMELVDDLLRRSLILHF